MIEIGLIIGGLTQVLKMTELVNEKYLPLAAVIIGGVLGFLIVGRDVLGVMSGVVAGLVTTGLVDRADHLAEKISY